MCACVCVSVYMFTGSHSSSWLVSLLLAHISRWNWGQVVLTGSLESQSSRGYIPPESIAKHFSEKIYTSPIKPHSHLHVFTLTLQRRKLRPGDGASQERNSMLISAPPLAIDSLTPPLHQMGTSALSKSPAWRGGSARCWPAVLVLKWERRKEWRRGQSREEALQLHFLVPHLLTDNSPGACILGQPMQLTPTMTLRWFSPSGVRREDAVYLQALWSHIQHVSQE